MANGLPVYVLIGISLGVFAAVIVLARRQPQVFRRFFGPLHPLAVFAAAIAGGFLLLVSLQSQNWFAIFQIANLNVLLPVLALAPLLALLMILVDLRIHFPQEMNVLFPESLLFYPAIGYLAEILFHVLPLAILLAALTLLFKGASFQTLLWVAFPLVALIESAYQAWPMIGEPRYPRWAAPAVGLHLFVFTIIQLLLFYRYDFLTMYAFRLAYYLFWHILWGQLRLRLLFPAAGAL